MEWQPIETAPRDGSWFMICNAADGFDSYEVGKFDPMPWPEYIRADTEAELYYKELRTVHEWRGFNNMHRATHWMPLPAPPVHAEDQ
jgi:hypothetical protein